MKMYTLEDVNEAATKLDIFINESLGKHPETDPLLDKLKTRKFQYDTLEEAETEFIEINKIYAADYPLILTALKKYSAKEYWPGMYVIHDLICAAAHLKFCIRYSLKDSKKETAND